MISTWLKSKSMKADYEKYRGSNANGSCVLGDRSMDSSVSCFHYSLITKCQCAIAGALLLGILLLVAMAVTGTSFGELKEFVKGFRG